jgi:hypothetical protein
MNAVTGLLSPVYDADPLSLKPLSKGWEDVVDYLAM